jgi:hypothetical protein
MKKLILTIILLSFILLISAQVNNKYIFGNSADVKTTLALGPVLKVSRLIEGYQLYTGIKGTMLFNDKIGFGLAGGGFVTEEVFRGLNDLGQEADLNTIMAYGGFNFDYILHTNSPVSISFQMLLGAAGVVLFSQEPGANGVSDEEMVEGGVFFIYEPSINLELNIARFLRMGLGVGYRFAFKGDMDRVSRKDLSDLTFNCSFLLGSF